MDGRAGVFISRGLLCVMGSVVSVAICAAQPASIPVAASPAAQQPPPAQASSVGNQLKAGEYITEKGWGHLTLRAQQGGLHFSLDSTTGEDVCELGGTVQGDRGLTVVEGGGEPCEVSFTRDARGVTVAALSAEQCKAFCGYNAEFEATYLQVAQECGRDVLAKARDSFRNLYDSKQYKAALATLSPALSACQSTLSWEEEGDIRNDVALAQHHNGQQAECRTTLAKYAEDAGKGDEEVVEGWPPALADRYLSIVQAARTNLGLCGGASNASHAGATSSAAAWQQAQSGHGRSP